MTERYHLPVALGRVSAVSTRFLRRLCLVTVLALGALLTSAPFALAADGIGIGGRADDKKVTYWGFGVMIFFVLVVILGSLLQNRLETRKERMRADLERVHRPV